MTFTDDYEAIRGKLDRKILLRKASKDNPGMLAQHLISHLRLV